MNKIKTILICLIIIFATCAICTGLIMMNEKTTTVKLSETCSINITGEYDTVFENGMNQIKIYDKFGNNKSTIVYSGANAPLSEVVTFGMLKMMFVGNTWDTGAEPMKTKMDGEEAYVIYTGNNITHDNILIISKNRDDCIKMYNSIKYNTNNATKNMNNTTNITTTIKEETTNQQEVQKEDSTDRAGTSNKENKQTTYIGKDGKTHTMEEAYSVDYSSGDLNIINEQRRERGMSEISA